MYQDAATFLAYVLKLVPIVFILTPTFTPTVPSITSLGMRTQGVTACPKTVQPAAALYRAVAQLRR